MKERLYGLLALVLCMAMAFSPVSGALADRNPCVVYTLEGQDDCALELGDLIHLIQSNVSLTSNYSGGQVRYYEGLYDGNEGAEYESVVAENAKNQITIEDGPWMVAAKGNNNENIDAWIAMECVGRFVDEKELGGNKVLLVMQGLQTVDSNMELTVGERMEKLRKRAIDDGYNAHVDFYQMSIYDKDTPVNNVMRRSAEQSVDDFITVELPYPAGYNQNNSTPDDYALFHLKAGGLIEKLPVILDSKSINVQVKDFSPYALAYKQLKNNGVSGGAGGDPDENQTVDLPQTGDDSRIALWFAFACAALAGLAAVRIRRRKYIG